MQNWSKKRHDKICFPKRMRGCNCYWEKWQGLKKNCGTERLRSRVNSNKKRYPIAPFRVNSLFLRSRNWNEDGTERLRSRVNGALKSYRSAPKSGTMKKVIRRVERYAIVPCRSRVKRQCGAKLVQKNATIRFVSLSARVGVVVTGQNGKN